VKKSKGPVQLVGPAVGGGAAPFVVGKSAAQALEATAINTAPLKSDDFELNMGPDPFSMIRLQPIVVLIWRLSQKGHSLGKRPQVPSLRDSHLAPSPGAAHRAINDQLDHRRVAEIGA
jgi:hypothetical protein